jgi:hypothetical protein
MRSGTATARARRVSSTSPPRVEERRASAQRAGGFQLSPDPPVRRPRLAANRRTRATERACGTSNAHPTPGKPRRNTLEVFLPLQRHLLGEDRRLLPCANRKVSRSYRPGKETPAVRAWRAVKALTIRTGVGRRPILNLTSAPLMDLELRVAAEIREAERSAFARGRRSSSR